MIGGRRPFLKGVAAGVCTPVLGSLASCTPARTKPPQTAAPRTFPEPSSQPETAPVSSKAAPPERTTTRPNHKAPSEQLEATSTDSELEDGQVPRRRFGRHNESVSVVGLGGHTLKLAGSVASAREIVARATSHGITFFENAWDYHGGSAEEVMGEALQGQSRDRLFLMSKFCTFHSERYSRDKAGAMKMLEDSLRRLRTDYLDLWMLHNVSGNDAELAYRDDSAIAALELAKKQGKIRYTGFTGHTDPKIHVDLIQRGFDWDATLMPVSALGALSAQRFEREVMPLCEQKNIAVLGMKGFGGSKRAFLHGKTNVEEIVRYSLSYQQVCSHMIGIDKLPYVNEAAHATQKKPMSTFERERHVFNLKAQNAEQYAMYLDPEYQQCYREGRLHPCQLG